MSKADNTSIGRYPHSPMKVIFLSPFMSKVMCDFQCCMSFAPHLCCFQEGKRNARNYLLIEILLLNAIALESKCLCVANCSPCRSYRHQESMIPLASFFFFPLQTYNCQHPQTLEKYYIKMRVYSKWTVFDIFYEIQILLWEKAKKRAIFLTHKTTLCIIWEV